MPKYEPLGQFLKSQTDDVVRLSLEQIDQMVDGLPRDAATPQFWANTSYHESRRRNWLGVGFKAFFVSPDYVRFERSKKPGQDWSEKELRICVHAYKQLVDAQNAGQILNKSALRRSVLGSLEGRTASAYEYRMQNISAVMEELGLPAVSGYRPARNVGRVADTIITLILDVFGLQDPSAIPRDDAEYLDFCSRIAEAKYALDPAKRPPVGSETPDRATKTVEYVKRDPEVVGWVKAQAKGNCEACGADAPFKDERGLPFLEVHHVRPLAEGGPDTPDNAVAICPNCHRALHRAENADARRRELISAVMRLVDYPAKPSTF